MTAQLDMFPTSTLTIGQQLLAAGYTYRDPTDADVAAYRELTGRPWPPYKKWIERDGEFVGAFDAHGAVELLELER